MEKWKGIVIVLIIAAVGGYGWYASRPPAPIQEQDREKPPAGELDLQKLVDKPAPEFNIAQSLWTNTPNNEPAVTVKSLSGHVAVIEFWRATCPHCQDAAPFMEKLYEKHKKDGLKMVGIQSPSDNPDPKFVENDWGQVRSVVDQWGITYPVGFDAHSELFKSKYYGASYPTVIVLDKNGVVRYTEIGYDDAKAKKLEQVVSQLIKTGTIEVPKNDAKTDGQEKK